MGKDFYPSVSPLLLSPLLHDLVSSQRRRAGKIEKLANRETNGSAGPVLPRCRERCQCQRVQVKPWRRL